MKMQSLSGRSLRKREKMPSNSENEDFTMKISVAMATYNGEKYITEQLDSLRNQTMPPDEVVICDDRSSDNTVNTVREYIEKHGLGDKWTISLNPENLGYANNFNRAAKKVSGDLIFFADQDDIWKENKIETMANIMEKHKDCKLLCTDYEPFITGKNAPEPPKSVLKKMPNDGSLKKVELEKKTVYIGALGCCMCARKEFLNEIEPYWFDKWAQDDRCWRLALCADGCYILHSNLMKHRIHDSNTATYGKYHSVEKRVKLFNDMKKADEEMLSMLEENGANEKTKKIMKKHIKMMELRIGLLSQKKFGNAIMLAKYMDCYQKKSSWGVEIVIALKNKF
jgi:glycosyltransferase involved in cell wall biosynthesis